jgi:GrpB-like predicted nucleotidyltransferase (UPF0157 family)
VTLHEATALLPRARVILAIERRRLLEAIPDAELTLTGSTSLPGMLTRGDVDLHLRVPADRFPDAVRLLEAQYIPVHPEIWTAGFATFETSEHELPTGIALTAMGDEHDERFRRTWLRLANDPASVERYGAIKRAYEAKPDAEYEAAKGAFFASLGLDD